MAGPPLEYTGTEKVNRLVSKLLDQRKTRPLMQDVGRIMKADTALNFRGQRSPEGAPWKPIQRRGQILSDTRRLRNSINYRTIGDDTVAIGTNVDYARVHQEGFEGKISVPGHTRRITQAFGKKLKFPVFQTVGPHQRFMRLDARPYLGVGPRAEKKIDRAVESWADKLLSE